MIYNDSLNSVYNYIRNGIPQTSYKVIMAYDSDVTPIAINGGAKVISIGLKAVEVGSRITVLTQAGEPVQTKDRDCMIEIEIVFYVPYTSGAEYLNSLCESVYSIICLKCPALDIQKIEIGDTSYKRETEALMLKSVLTVKKTLNF